MFYFNYACWIYCCTNIKNIKSIRTGFDLTTRDSYITILVEVFTNHILAEKIYFKNHIEWTEHKIMVVNRQVSAKLFDNEIISKTFLSTISTIIHFFIKQRFCKHHFFVEPKQQTQKTSQLSFTIWFTVVLENHFLKLCSTKKFNLSCSKKMYHFEKLS